MTRVKRGNIARKRRKRILKLSKGFRGTNSSLFSVSKQQILKALKYSYIGRKNKIRNYRRLWIVRINAAVRSNGLTYNKFIHNLKASKVALNRKMLSQLAIIDITTFNLIIKSTL